MFLRTTSAAHLLLLCWATHGATCTAFELTLYRAHMRHVLQAMILVEDPYYNEPAHEAARGTDTGRSSAAAYNAELTLNVGVINMRGSSAPH